MCVFWFSMRWGKQSWEASAEQRRVCFAVPSALGKPYSCSPEQDQTSASSETQGRWKGLISTRAGFRSWPDCRACGGKRRGGKAMEHLPCSDKSC